MDDELEQFKRKIDLAELAASYGFTLDGKPSRTSLKMKNYGYKIVVATAEDDHGIFFEVHGERSGSVIDFVMWQEGVNLGHARKILRGYTGQYNSSFPTANFGFTRPAPITRDRATVLATWERKYFA